jgi:hypothetical protein
VLFGLTKGEDKEEVITLGLTETGIEDPKEANE